MFLIYQKLADDYKKFYQLENQIKDTEIIMYYLDKCGYCVKMKEMLQPYSEHIIYKNVMEPEVQEEIKEYGVTGFPYFRSKKHNTSHLGAVSDIQSLIANLLMTESL